MSEHDEAYKLGRKHVESLKNASEVTTWPRDEIEVSAGYFASGYLAGRESMRAEVKRDMDDEVKDQVDLLWQERERSQKLLEYIKLIEPKLTCLADTLRKAKRPENICIAEHDAVLIAIGYLNARKIIAEYEGQANE